MTVKTFAGDEGVYSVLSLHENKGLSVISKYFTADKQVTSAQIKEHRGAVLDLIEVYLRGEFMQLMQSAHLVLCLPSVCTLLFSPNNYSNILLESTAW